jgi:hypothetical protein
MVRFITFKDRYNKKEHEVNPEAVCYVNEAPGIIQDALKVSDDPPSEDGSFIHFSNATLHVAGSKEEVLRRLRGEDY